MTKVKYCAFIITPFLFLAACSGRITGAIGTNQSGEFLIEASLAPSSARLLSPLSPATVSGKPAPVLDAGIISLSLKDAPGISSVQLSNTSPESISGSLGFSKISDFLTAGGRRFITWEQSAASGRAVISLDRATAPMMLTLFSQEVADYLSAIMAPLATGEALSKTEYLRLVTSVYGAAVAREIGEAEISAQINFPGIITSITGTNGASHSGGIVRFRANLVDILVLEQPIVYDIKWTPYR